MALKFVRSLAKSISYLFSFVPEPSKLEREEGISALVVSRNEPFIEPSLKSILNIVDEIVLVDSSSGKWKKQVHKVSKISKKINLVSTEPDYEKQMKIGFSLTKKKWILKWDADFVGFSKIDELRNMIDSLVPSKYYVFYFPVINLELDFFHTDPKSRFHLGHRLFHYSPRLLSPTTSLLRTINKIYMRTKGLFPARTAYGPIPIWYYRKTLNYPYAVHLKSIKPRKRIVERRFQHLWTILPSFRKKIHGNLDNFVDVQLKKMDVSYDDIYEIIIDRMKKGLITYDGVHPKILKNWVIENLHVNFSPTKDFEMKLKEYLKD